jgi:hypothetical protein
MSIAYKSPFISTNIETLFISKLQTTGDTGSPSTPACDNEETCNSESVRLGVSSCFHGNPLTLGINALVSGASCDNIPECSVTEIRFDNGNTNDPISFDCSSPELANCSEGGCLVSFTCEAPQFSDDFCPGFSATVQCTGGEPVACDSNLQPA